MSTSLTKYVAASALAGVIAFGGFTIAGAQDGATTTTAPTEQDQTAPPAGEAPDGARPEGGRPDGADCDREKGEAPAEGSSTQPAPGTSSGSTESSNSTST